MKRLSVSDIREVLSGDLMLFISDMLYHSEYDGWEDGFRKGHPDMAFLGSGGSAVVLEHPDDPSLVIRVSEEGDGWVNYVCGSAPNPLLPQVLSLGWTGDFWVALVERLEPVEDERSTRLIQDLSAAAFDGATDVDPDALALVRDAQSRGVVFDDLVNRNVMVRPCGQIVLNDPSTILPWADMQRLKEEFRVSDTDPGGPGL